MKTLMLIKSFIYRIYGFLVAFIVAFLITGSFTASLSIGIVESLVKIVTYYWFDLVWNKFTRGKYKPAVIWLTGLSGSGKTTIANEIFKKLKEKDVPVMLLDGDEVRRVIKHTGFDEASRKQHNRNVGYISHLFEKQGNIVIVSLISPYKDTRDECRKMCDNFVEVYVNTPLEECERRDVKGLYKSFRDGKVKDLTGLTPNAPYEKPDMAEIEINTINNSVEECAEEIIKYLTNHKKPSV